MEIHRGSGFFEKNRVSESKLVFVFPSRRDVRFRISGDNFEPDRSHPTQQIWLLPLRSACGHYLLTALYREVCPDWMLNHGRPDVLDNSAGCEKYATNILFMEHSKSQDNKR
jgi:hypothetical protein